MIRKILILIAVVSGLSSCGQTVTRDQNEVVVVELFTSEGCSSCPPADALADQLAGDSEYKNVFFLNFHVDYWNKLGWKDPFSSAQWSARQSGYSQIFSDRVYTPQMIVNGAEEFVGSDKAKAVKAIEKWSSVVNKHHIRLNRESGDIFHYTVDGPLKDQLLCYAIVELDLNSNIVRGENAGKKIHHKSVVRSMRTITAEF